MAEIMQGILLPFFGTVLGSACVFVMRGTLHVAAGFTGMLALDVALG